VARFFLTSRLLSAASVVHGFSVRDGGVSAGPFSTLNVSRAVGDEPAAVERNLELLAEAAGLAGGRAFATATQVHGDRVLAFAPSGLRELFAESQPVGQPLGAADPANESADAIVGLAPGAAVGVRVADCVPVLLHDPESGAVAAVHSGWRGARLSIAARGVRGLQHAAGSDPARVLAAIGPCIGRCCYEVSRELAALFRDLFGPEAADDPAGASQPHLDLRRCVERALLESGLTPDHIEQVEGCTACDAALFFSHRRDQGRTGRHLAFAAGGRGL
jgi:YfiH family protein